MSKAAWEGGAPELNSPETKVPLEWKKATLVLLAFHAAIAGTVWLVLLRDLPWLGDAADYVEAAELLSTGHHFPNGHYWPPGLPYLLAPVIDILPGSRGAIRLVMLLCGLAFVASAVLLGHSIAGKSRISLIAGFMAAIYPPLILLDGQPFSQVPSAVAVALSIAGAVNWIRGAPRAGWWLLVSGAASGCAILLRPSNALVALVLAVAATVAAVLRVRRNGASPATLFQLLPAGAIGLMILIPTLRFNHERTGQLTISTNNERNFFLGNNPFTHQYKTWHFASRALTDLPPDAAAYLDSVYSSPNRRGAMLAAARQEITGHPGRFLVRTASRIRAFWGFDYLGSNLIAADRSAGLVARLALVAVEGGGYLLVAMLAIAGVFGSRLVSGGWPLLLIGSIAAIQFPYTLAFSAGTYHFAAAVPLLVLAAIGADCLLDRTVRNRLVRDRRLLVGWILLLMIQVEYAWWVLVV